MEYVCDGEADCRDRTDEQVDYFLNYMLLDYSRITFLVAVNFEI